MLFNKLAALAFVLTAVAGFTQAVPLAKRSRVTPALGNTNPDVHAPEGKVDPNWKYDIPAAKKFVPSFKQDHLTADKRANITEADYHRIRQRVPCNSTIVREAEAAQLAKRDTLYSHGGDILGANTINVYLVFFGTGFDWYCDQNGQNCETVDQLVQTFYSEVEYLPWYNVLNQYTGYNNDYIHGFVQLTSVIYDSNPTSSIDGNFIVNYLYNAASNSFGIDPNGVYGFVVGSSVTLVGDSSSNYPNNFWGYHSWFTASNGAQLKFLFTGEYAAASVMAHEFAETATDPGLNAWFDNSGEETGDVCWPNSGLQWYNGYPGSTYFAVQIQPTWSNNANGCSFGEVPAHTCFQNCIPGSSLYQNYYLNPNDQIYSQNGAYRFIFQEDGNAVLYRTSDNYPLWASNTWNYNPASFVMQGDGNLVGYFYNRGPWASQSWHSGAGTYCFAVQDDSNIVVYDANCGPVWARF